MAKRVHRRLKRALEEQKNLEEELEKLQSAQDPKERCQEIIKFIQVPGEDGALKPDPMTDTENNPFTIPDCFVAGTSILVNAKGDRVNIEDLRIGDKVVCLLPSDKERELFDFPIEDYPKHWHEARVTNVYCVTKHETVSMKCRNSSTNEEIVIECTSGHPMYVYGKGWKTASGSYNRAHGYKFEVGQLEVGDSFCLESGDLAEITALKHHFYEEGINVYNLSVSHGRTYFANGILTHNKCCVIL